MLHLAYGVTTLADTRLLSITIAINEAYFMHLGLWLQSHCWWFCKACEIHTKMAILEVFDNPKYNIGISIQDGVDMKYLTGKEVGRKWGITGRYDKLLLA